MRIVAILLLLLPGLAIAHGDLHLQIERMDGEIAKAPRDAALISHRADLKRYHEEWQGALEDYGKALKLDSRLADARLGLGELYLEWNKPRQALDPLEAFLQLKPKDAVGLSVKARALEALGRHDEAAKVFASSLRGKPDIEVFMEEIQSLTKAGRLGEAVMVVDQGLAQLGALPVLERQGIALERSLGRFEDALKRNARMLARPGRKEALLELRGDIFEQAGQKDKAKAAWKTALAEMDKLSEARRKVQAAQDLEARLKKKLDSA